ncbi:MAG: hypothetical protein WCD46_10420, partial [Desulfobacterales bacterium]
MGAPFYRSFLFGENDWVFHLVAGFGFEHEYRIGVFSHEIRLVFEMVSTMPVKDLELPLCGFEPFERVAIKASFRSASESNFCTVYRQR